MMMVMMIMMMRDDNNDALFAPPDGLRVPSGPRPQ